RRPPSSSTGRSRPTGTSSSSVVTAHRPGTSDDTHEGGDTMTVRMAVVGAGWVTLNRHVPSLRRHPEVDLVGMVVPESVMRRVRADGTPERVGIGHLGSSLHEPVMADVDAVMIGTPPH